MIKFKVKQLPTQNSEGGFTIIESLMAIIVVSILLIGIAPVIVLSTATRIQAKRVEQATQAARTYVDGLRTGNIEPPTNTVDIKDAKNPIEILEKIAAFEVPKKLDDTDSFCFDVDGGGCSKNSSKDLRIQAFRMVGDATKAYSVSLRIYRADGLKEGGTLKKSTANKKETQNTFGASVGGDALTRPLLEMTTQIGTSDTSFSDFCTRLNDTSNTQSDCQ